MFYYPAVLKRHTGCFATIWLVATKGVRVPRRDFLKVNVKSTCENIMNYVLEQVPPPRPGLPRPRFSLYLSSQLQYGLIVVYHRQCAILLEELQSVLGQLVKQKTWQKIDLDEQGRQTLLFQDALSLLEETEGAPDPLFGVMHLLEGVASPSTLMQMGKKHLREASPEQPELSTASPAAAAAAGESAGITASPEAITLRETEPAAIPVPEFEGVELSDHHPDTIDILMAQPDAFPEEDVEGGEVTPAEQERETQRERRERDQERQRTGDLTGSSLELQPTTVSNGGTTLLPQEEPGPPTEATASPSRHLTPVSAPILPSPPPALRRRGMESERVPVPEARVQRRKRQLIFFDPETQIPQEKLQQQIDNPVIETRALLFPPSESQRMRPAAECLNNPCTSLPEELLLLWRQAATITPLPGDDLQVGERGPESTDSEREREREVAEREEDRPEVSSEEVWMGQGSLPLESSDQREEPPEISPMHPPDREESVMSRSVSTLQDIPEELPGRESAESPGLMPEYEPELFQSLLPPEADRRTISNIFQRLLESVSSRKLSVEQAEPYGDIWILPGPDYKTLLQTS
ncbi:meiotic recombination protein REC8 homolog [Aulostomus maculatus]